MDLGQRDSYLVGGLGSLLYLLYQNAFQKDKTHEYKK